MPIEPQRGEPVDLFLFAHQDDEFGVFHLIDECRRQGRRAACAYLTRGVNGLAGTRNAESLRVLGKLGVDASDVVFAGDLLAIDDAHLPLSLDAAGAWIGEWIGSFDTVGRIHVTAWEGGHHDHDALHALTLHAARRLALLPKVRQFALYNHKGCPGPLFRVLSPLAANGPVELQPVRWAKRLHYLRLCLAYPSQRTTWIGLFPFVLLHYLLDGRQALQAVSMERLDQRPHPGTLYYEQRGFFEWERMRDTLLRWQGR
ncbi:PIG-L deacetylase family protein [Massilia niabensis]|uniref:PIG-L deacetylase family protein n=1 Tax=Massilia niabensis TaxID=544910 RepID=A0ABW0L8K4_9BURK